MMALWSSFDMKGASLAQMYFFLIGTWRLNILKILLLYIPKLSMLKVYHIWIWYYRSFYNLGFYSLCWNRLGRFVSTRSIHAGLPEFLKHVGSLIKLLRQFMPQKCFIEFSSIKIQFEFSPYSVRIQEIRTRITPNTDTLYAVTDYSKSTAGAVDSRGIFRTLSKVYDGDLLFKEIQIASSK